MDNCRSDLGQVLEAQASLANLLHKLLSAKEIEQIDQQFNHECRRDSQVLWSGVSREVAQVWADKRNLQTLTTAMGPLMDTQHSSCLKPKKSPRQWSLYMKGASALFACHITRSSKVTVLLPPPPEKLNPNGYTNYQLIEEPILKGMFGGRSVGCIQMVHPTVGGAEDFSYQSWPVDRTADWTKTFPHPTMARTSWRTVKIQLDVQHIIAIVAVARRDFFHTESMASLPFPDSTLAEGIAFIERKEKGSRAPSERLLHGLESARDQSQDQTHTVEKKRAEEVKAKKRRKKKEIVKKAREGGEKSKKANEEKAKTAREEKAKRKKANEEREKNAREEKAKRKRANEEEKKAREEKNKKAREEKEKKAREKGEKETDK